MNNNGGGQQAAPAFDYKLAALIPWLTRGEPLARPLRTAALQPLYTAATKNLQRADGIVSSTALAFWAGRMAASQRPPAELAGVAMHDALAAGLETWQATANMPNATIFGLGIAGTLSAYVVQAWTAFETLVTDLWEVALNTHPDALSQLADAKTNDIVETGGKTVSLSILQKYDYDLKAVMGTVLRSKFKFDSLDGIREAYLAAFGKKGMEALHEALADDALSAASAIRQVIVHRAGVVDEKYVRRSANLALAPKLKVGAELVLDGEIVAGLLSTAVPKALDVLLFVDEWIVTHEQGQRGGARAT